MSITVERPTSSMARAEYSVESSAKRRNRLRLSIGAQSAPAPARRDVLRNCLRSNFFSSS
jgi:hypothetical protein